MKVYDLIENAIDVRLMDVPNITSIILDYIETYIYYFHYEETDYEDPDYDEVKDTTKAIILAGNEDEAYELFIAQAEGLIDFKIDKETFMGNLTMNEHKRYFTSPKVHHFYRNIVAEGLDRKFRWVRDTYEFYEYKHGKGVKRLGHSRRYI